MIKKLLSVTLIAIAFCTQAQQLIPGNPVHIDVSNMRLGSGNQTLAVNDTLRPTSLTGSGCGTMTSNIVYYVNNVRPNFHDSGYTFGTGVLNTGGGPAVEFSELAMRYKMVGNGTLIKVLVIAAKAKGATTTTVSKIYSVNTNGSPNALLGTSTPLPMSSYTPALYTAYTFTSNINVTNTSFFASITVPAFGGTDHDTLALFSTKAPSCNSNDSLSWVKYGTSWFSVKYLFGPNGNTDLFIFPVVSVANGVENYINKGDLNLWAASPNPASSSININFSLNSSSKVEIEVYDIAGKVVKTVKGTDFYSIGKGSIPVDVTSLESGSYMYSISACGSKIFSKFIVTK